MVCNGSDCLKKGAKKICKAAQRCAKDMNRGKETIVVRTKCTGLCKNAPVVSVQPTNAWVLNATAVKVVKAMQAGQIAS